MSGLRKFALLTTWWPQAHVRGCTGIYMLNAFSKAVEAWNQLICWLFEFWGKLPQVPLALNRKKAYRQASPAKRGYFDQISLISLFTPTYFKVTVSRSEIKPTGTFNVPNAWKIQPLKSYDFGIKATVIQSDWNSPRKWGYFDQIIFNANETASERFFAFPRLHYYISHNVPRPSTLLG